MLILTRKEQERLRIARTVTVAVLEVRGNSVKLGIEAPASLHIAREELLSEIAGSGRANRNRTGTKL